MCADVLPAHECQYGVAAGDGFAADDAADEIGEGTSVSCSSAYIVGAQRPHSSSRAGFVGGPD